jgi:hypothetical protein
VEERRYKSNDAGFGGENPQAAIIRDIMAKTGCMIEMNQSKDHSLTIMVTGRPSAVKEAHRFITTDLQTKVISSLIIMHY